MKVTLENLIGQQCVVRYCTSKEQSEEVTGVLLDVINLSEHMTFLVLSNDEGETMVSLEAVYTIKLKIKQTKKPEEKSYDVS